MKPIETDRLMRPELFSASAMRLLYYILYYMLSYLLHYVLSYVLSYILSYVLKRLFLPLPTIGRLLC
jgi:predicted PurR-regulated permease PerM